MICSRSHRLMTVLGNETSILRNTNNWPTTLFFKSDMGICDWRRKLSLRTVKFMREQVHRFNLLGPWHLLLVLSNSLTVVGSVGLLVCLGFFLVWVFWGGLEDCYSTSSRKYQNSVEDACFSWKWSWEISIENWGFFSKINSSFKSTFTGFIAVWISQLWNIWNILYIFYTSAARQ